MGWSVIWPMAPAGCAKRRTEAPLRRGRRFRLPHASQALRFQLFDVECVGWTFDCHRLVPLGRLLMTGQDEQVLRVAVDPDGDPIQLGQAGQTVRVPLPVLDEYLEAWIKGGGIGPYPEMEK